MMPVRGVVWYRMTHRTTHRTVPYRKIRPKKRIVYGRIVYGRIVYGRILYGRIRYSTAVRLWSNTYNMENLDQTITLLT